MPFHAGAARSVPSPVVRIRRRQVCGPPLGALLQVLVAVELGQQSLLTPQLGVVGVALELYVELPCGGFGVAGHLRGPGTGAEATDLLATRARRAEERRVGKGGARTC